MLKTPTNEMVPINVLPTSCSTSKSLTQDFGRQIESLPAQLENPANQPFGLVPSRAKRHQSGPPRSIRLQAPSPTTGMILEYARAAASSQRDPKPAVRARCGRDRRPWNIDGDGPHHSHQVKTPSAAGSATVDFNRLDFHWGVLALRGRGASLRHWREGKRVAIAAACQRSWQLQLRQLRRRLRK